MLWSMGSQRVRLSDLTELNTNVYAGILKNMFRLLQASNHNILVN